MAKNGHIGVRIVVTRTDEALAWFRSYDAILMLLGLPGQLYFQTFFRGVSYPSSIVILTAARLKYNQWALLLPETARSLAVISHGKTSVCMPDSLF